MKNIIFFVYVISISTSIYSLTSLSTPRLRGNAQEIPFTELEALNKTKKVITINDTKLAQFGILKNQLVFSAQLPQSIDEEKFYELMNGVQILFKAKQDMQDSSKLNIVCYRITPTIKPGISLKKEFVTIALPKTELNKEFFFGTTNNEFSIFNKQGNDIIKTTLIKKMVE